MASAASFYEVGNKHRTGKLKLDTSGLRKTVSVFEIGVLPLTADVMEQAANLDWSHRDPWDRIIAAQALASGSILVSSDRAFDEVAGLTRLWRSRAPPNQPRLLFRNSATDARSPTA